MGLQWCTTGLVVLPVSLLLAYGCSLISEALGLQPYAADAAEGLGTGLQGVYEAALSGLIDPALPAGVTTFLGRITPLPSDAAAVLDPTTMVQGLTRALDPSVLAAGLDLNATADIGTLVDASPIPDIGGVLTSLIP
jgi:hypothetical protein